MRIAARRTARLVGVAVVATLVGGLAGCAEEPSYRLRWAVEGSASTVPVHCAEAGLFEVRARAYVDAVRFVDERIYPCAPAALEDPEGLVNGSTLPPGRYAIQLRGIDRRGEPWSDPDAIVVDPTEAERECNPDASTIGCRPTELVCDCQRLVVTAEGEAAPDDDDAAIVGEGSTVDLPEFVLRPPPPCNDGIDNDRDGLVDASDPSCEVDFGDGTEDVPVGVTEIRLSLTLMGENPVALCNTVPLTRIQLRLEDDEGGYEVMLEEDCQLERPYVLSTRLPAGIHTFSVVGLDDATDRGGSEVTTAERFQGEISELGGTVVASVDFAPEDFLVPIEGFARIAPAYVSALGIDAAPRTTCDADGTEGTLSIDSLRMFMVNGHGGPLSSPVALADGTLLDGETPLACGSVFDTESLTWGSYGVVIEALSSEGEVCFSNVDAPAPMRPSELLSVYLPRWYGDDGLVPASCRECEAATDCDPDDGSWDCLGGVCQRPCRSDLDCASEALGDLGFACDVAGYCRMPAP